MYRDPGMATRSAERTGKRPGCDLPVSRNPEFHATVPSLQRIESHARRWGSLGLPHGPVRATHHRGIHISVQRHSKLKVLCGIVYLTTIDFGSRVVSKLKVGSSNKLMDSDSEMEEETIHLEPLIRRVRDSLKSLSVGRVPKVDSSSVVVKSFQRHFEIVCRLLSIFEQCGPSSGPFQKSMEYSFIHSFLCLLSRFNELSTFFEKPSNLSAEVEACKKAFPSDRLDLIPLIGACSTYLQDNHKSELEMKIPIGTKPPSEYLEESVLESVIDKVYSIVKRYLVPSDFDGKEVDDKNLPILSKDLSQFGNQTLLDDPTVLGDLSLDDLRQLDSQDLFADEFDDQTVLSDLSPFDDQASILSDDPSLIGNQPLFDGHLDPLLQVQPASLLPSFSATFLNRTRLKSIPCSSEPLQDPLHLPDPISFSSLAPSTSGFSSSQCVSVDVEEIISNESDSHSTECRSKSHRPLKRGSSSFSGRKKVAPKIQKIPSRGQIAIDDSHSTPPTSLNRSFSSSGHPIATQVDIQADNPISSESGDIPLTDENLQFLKGYQKAFKSIRGQHFFDNATAANPTCLLCNSHVRLPLEHIKLHLTGKKQTLKQLLHYCCDSERAPPIMNAHTIAKLIKNSFEEVKACPVCFVPSDEGWTHLGQHILHVHLKGVERNCDQLDTLVKKCFVNVSDGESGVKKYSCVICGTAYQSDRTHKVPVALHRHIEECLRRVKNSANRSLLDLAAVYEWFLNLEEVKHGKCPHCKNKIKDFLWAHYHKCQANYTCGGESGSYRRICPDCHIPFGYEDFFKAHYKSCNKLRDVKTRFKSEGYYDRLPDQSSKVTCSVSLDGTTKCGEICWISTLPAHLATAHQIEGIKDENWILCNGKCWCQWCGEGLGRFQHQ